MNKSYLSLSACALLATFTFVGCGSSSNNSSSSTSTGSLQLNPYLGNIDYVCGSNSGTTNDNGEYNFNAGDECEFTFGGVKLKSTAGANLTIDSILEDTTKNPNVSSDAIWGYVSAATGLTQAELSKAQNAKISETFKSATDDITDFSSFDKFSESLLSDIDVDSDLKTKFEKNKGKIASAKTSKRVEVKFEEIQTPVTEIDKLTQQASSKVMINGTEQEISYTPIMHTNYQDDTTKEIFGLVKDMNDEAITFGEGEPYICNGTNEGVGSGLDYSSFLNVNDKLYMVSQFECQIGAMYMTELEQKEDGKLSAKEGTLEFISQKDEFGGFVHCAGQKTPWESHLGSEEYETDARAVEAAGFDKATGSKYYDETAKFWGGDFTKMNPYYYGWSPEVKISDDGEAQYSKHYSMGRFSHELSYVMPDNKTVYMSDDGTNVGLFMFVADKAKDLSTGTLYAAKWNQTSEIGVGAGEADITWINLGHSTNSEIRDYLDPDGDVTTNDALNFSDIFEVSEGIDGTCSEGFTSVNTSAGQECLKLKDGMEKAASRLETRRYAAYMGATTEFRKEEGITFDKNSGTLYVAMSSVERGMEENSSNDLGGNDDIKVEQNKCGAVYALDVSTNMLKDTADSKISSKYVVENMYSILEGNPITYEDGTTYAGNYCDVNGISNPDNVSFLPNSDVLTIGEDTGKHENNVVWSYNVKTKELTRTFTTPVGAESTSPFWYTDLANGFGYMSVVTQHPDDNTTDAGQSVIGYVGPFKNLTELNDVKTIDSVTKIATLETSKEAGSEIVAFDKNSQKMFTTNGADNTLDITPMNEDGTLGTTTQVDLSTYGAGVQSVAVANGKVAVAVGSSDKVTTKGKVVVFDVEGNLISQTTVGYLPDMVTFSEDGAKVIVANEGEPDASSGTYVDVAGTVGIVTLADANVEDNDTGYAEVGFENATLSNAEDETPVRLGGTPSDDKALDLEPEYITVSGTYAYVTLQENNAVAKIDISTSTPVVIAVKSLGSKDYENENTIDIEEEGFALMKNYKGLKGLYMPDSIASYKVDGKTYLVTANEGDGREYLDSSDNDVFVDEAKIKKLDLDSVISASYSDENDLKVITDMGDTDLDGDYDKLYAFGARSFTIWDDEANLVWDSGDALSKITSKMMPNLFNQDDGDIDGRSGNKGVEPEAITVGKIGTQTYAFVGLERQNAIVVYDITIPADAKFVKFINTQKDGDISPEGMKFIKADNSPTGNALLLVAFEMSGSTAVYEIK